MCFKCQCASSRTTFVFKHRTWLQLEERTLCKCKLNYQRLLGITSTPYSSRLVWTELVYLLVCLRTRRPVWKHALDPLLPNYYRTTAVFLHRKDYQDHQGRLAWAITTPFSKLNPPSIGVESPLTRPIALESPLSEQKLC